MSIGGHQSPVNLTDIWLTPPSIIQALGEFDLDPCAAPVPRPWTTAKRMLALPTDGLKEEWEGRVFCNPPYGRRSLIDPWMAKMAAHNHGIALIFARTETEMFVERVWKRASGLLFIAGRLHFHHRDGRRAVANSGAPSVLISYGDDDRDVLASEPVAGAFVPLHMPKHYVVATLDKTWRDVVHQALMKGPVSCADLYRALQAHPKSKANPHWREKIRQTLQRGPFKSLGDGVWEMAA